MPILKKQKGANRTFLSALPVIYGRANDVHFKHIKAFFMTLFDINIVNLYATDEFINHRQISRFISSTRSGVRRVFRRSWLATMTFRRSLAIDALVGSSPPPNNVLQNPFFISAPEQLSKQTFLFDINVTQRTVFTQESCHDVIIALTCCRVFKINDRLTVV